MLIEAFPIDGRVPALESTRKSPARGRHQPASGERFQINPGKTIARPIDQPDSVGFGGQKGFTAFEGGIEEVSHRRAFIGAGVSASQAKIHFRPISFGLAVEKIPPVAILPPK
jgi:hypothetical protein